jgi:hypothetical protein
MFVLLIKGAMENVIEMASYGVIYLVSFMTIGTDIQAVWRFYLRNLRDCIIDITDGMDL